eukprot:COSAG02_NODE_290_length_25531_cov_75.132392_16_plen_152_part_00
MHWQVVTYEEPITEIQRRTDWETEEVTELRTEYETRVRTEWEPVETEVVVVKTRAVPRVYSSGFLQQEYEEIEYETHEVPVTVEYDEPVTVEHTTYRDVPVTVEEEVVTGMSLLRACARTHRPAVFAAQCTRSYIPEGRTQRVMRSQDTRR